MAIAYDRVGDRYDEPVGDQLPIQRLDTIALFYVLFLSPFVEEVGEVGDDTGPGLEIVDGFGGQEAAGAGGRRRSDDMGGGEMARAFGGYQCPPDIGMGDAEVGEVVDDDKVGGIAHPQLA